MASTERGSPLLGDAKGAQVRIVISGSHSGDNPQPGVGIARSLRLAYPRVHLIALEHSRRSLGVHWPDFNEVWIEPDWTEIDLESHASDLIGRLGPGDLWIPAQDVEVAWLASSGGHEGVLVPPSASVQRVAKHVLAREGLLGQLQSPPSIGVEAPPESVLDFCILHDWRVWLKGPFYEAVRVRTWRELQECRDRMGRLWSTGDLFVQAHIDGTEESIAFAASNGKLLDAVSMRKREVSSAGKTWAGRVLPLCAAEAEMVSDLVKNLDWTGGGEVEFVTDEAGIRWLIDFNSRFPAWIHGATMAGRNLPAALVYDATGCPPAAPEQTSEEFIRVVLEIPARLELPLPEQNRLPEPGEVMLSKHAAGMPLLAKSLAAFPAALPCDTKVQEARATEEPAPPHDFSSIRVGRIETPAYHFMATDSRGRFARAAKLAEDAGATSGIEVALAYSIKTNPDERLLGCALAAGMWAEAISLLEVAEARAAGFPSARIILNGPGKWWPPSAPQEPVGTLFCDSMDEYRAVTESASGLPGYPASTIGLRLRAAGVESRFGIPADAAWLGEMGSMSRHAGRALALHFHCASSAIGIPAWWSRVEEFVAQAVRLEAECGMTVECLDLGGGWTPTAFWGMLADSLPGAVDWLGSSLPGLRRVVLEPGKALAQPSFALITSVLDVRERPSGGREVVIDGSVAEVPFAADAPHRAFVFSRRQKAWRRIDDGADRVLGRLCMEDDILLERVSLSSVETSDLIAICDVGAYDMSMSYPFGRGASETGPAKNDRVGSMRLAVEEN